MTQPGVRGRIYGSVEGAPPMHYDIEVDWQLLNTCNYRCGYCFFPPSVLGEKLTVHAAPEAWAQAIDRTGLTWLLHVTGGEPTIYPQFAELLQRLTAKHYLSFNSNLTNRSVVDLVDRVDPARISFINAGLHALERHRRKGLGIFLEHAALLRERKFPIFISIVATSDVLAQVDEIIALAAPTGMVPIPKLLRGSYEGRNYPAAYSAEEKSTFVRFGRTRQCKLRRSVRELGRSSQHQYFRRRALLGWHARLPRPKVRCRKQIHQHAARWTRLSLRAHRARTTWATTSTARFGRRRGGATATRPTASISV